MMDCSRVLRVTFAFQIAVIALLLAGSQSVASSHARADQPSSPAVRQRILLDSGWRFYREPKPIDPMTQTGMPVANWKYRPYSGGVPSTDMRVLGAESMDVSANNWKPIAIGDDAFGGRNGFAWFRATVAAHTARPLRIRFAGVDDNATVFLNGTFIGSHRGWDDPFDFSPGSAWKTSGSNVLSVLVENTGGYGGIYKPVLLQSADSYSVTQASPGFDDRSWRIVHLPHDYVVEGTIDPRADMSHGFLPVTSAWYRKKFTLPASDQGKSVWIDFDGAYRQAEVWLNGQYVGLHKSGYAGFRFDISHLIHYGKSNELAVHVDATQFEGWFYEGGGIYRHVWLNVADPLHITPDGTFVSSDIALRGARSSARIHISTEITNASDLRQRCQLLSDVIGPDGKRVGSSTASVIVPARTTAVVAQSVAEPRARLWSLEKPQLYELKASVVRGGRSTDACSTPFGLRTIRFDHDKGFFLNGKHVEIKGTCNHQDFAGVGSAIPDNLLYWRVKMLKAMGSNAYRTSHNEVASALLDACDRLGMLVMDENRNFSDSVGDLADLTQMIKRDRNHPSVILWSIANEERAEGTPDGHRIGMAMRRAIHKYDPTRPITAAMNDGWGPGGLSDALDVQGFNYHYEQYAPFHAAHPTTPIFGSETSSTIRTRGEYADDPAKGYVSSYNMDGSVWEIMTRPYAAGSFAWTGFDYRGEPSPYQWPDVNSNFGSMDMCGFPKENYYFYQAWWIDKPLVHILPHWNRPGKEGQPIAVCVVGNTDRVELFFNGKSLGAKDMPKFDHLEWSVPYSPGTLIAKGYTNGKLVATDTVETTGAPAAVRLTTPHIETLSANGEDAAVVWADIVDSQGRIVPTASNLVKFTVTGGGHVDGVGNGDPACHEPDKASQRSAFHGRCALIVQTNEGSPKPIRVVARADGLAPAMLTLEVK